MRILLVTHRYPPFGLTGVERLCEQTASALTSAGHEVIVMMRRETPAPPVPRLEWTTLDGIDVVMVSGGGPSHERFPRHARVLDRSFERTLLDVQPDVVLISHLINHSPGYVAIAHRWRIPVVMELHDFYVACERAHLERRSGGLCQGPEGGAACATHCFPDQSQARAVWALRTHAFRRALEASDAAISPSEFVAEYFRESFGATMPPLHVIGNGVELTGRLVRPRRPEPRPLHLACVGVVTPHKGTHVVVDALRIARLTEAKLTLFGTITQPYLGQLRRTAERIDNLTFRAYGSFHPGELPQLLADVDAVIAPSLVWETYSIAAREAMACGVPVIASRMGALPEGIRHGENGLLFDPASPLELATILQMIDAERERLNDLRAGIRPTDWISVKERTRQVELVLNDVVTAGTCAWPAAELGELSILREELLDGSSAV